MSTEVIKTEDKKEVSSTPMQMITHALNSGHSIEQMTALMDLEERWNARESSKAYIQAMSKFQSECPVIKKLKDGYNYKYAPLEDIIAQIKTLLSQCGLSYRFSQEENDGVIKVTCIVTHKDGHSESMQMSGKAESTKNQNSIQASASVVTYLRRYTLTGVLGLVVADEDSDGRVDQSRGCTKTDKQWLRAIRAGTQTIEAIEDPEYREHIESLLGDLL